MRDYVNSTALQEYTTKLVAKLKTLFPGTPTAAATVADMTDHSKTYVYVGSETGYTAGDWYYWDGTAWTSGGPFQATSIITDTTLAVAGEAADAKATGDAIAAAKTAVLNAMAPAYSTSATYAVGDYVNHNGSIYRCTTAISTAESWTAGHWTAVVLGADLASQVSDLKTQLSNDYDAIAQAEKLNLNLVWRQGAINTTTGDDSDTAPAKNIRCDYFTANSYYLNFHYISGKRYKVFKYDENGLAEQTGWLTADYGFQNTFLKYRIMVNSDNAISPDDSFVTAYITPKWTDDISRLNTRLDTTDATLSATTTSLRNAINEKGAKLLNRWNIGNSDKVVTPTYDGSGEATHPSIVFTNDGFCGYKWWLGITPYPGSQDEFEDPQILVSNDGITFDYFPGCPNPLDKLTAADIASGAHNCDIDLCLVDDTMYCFWLYAPGDGAGHPDHNSSILYERHTTDGVNWSEKNAILTNSEFETDHHFFASPAFVYEPDSEKWKMWFVSDVKVDGNDRVWYTECASDFTGWTEPVTVSFGNNVLVKIWHLDVIKTASRYELVGCGYQLIDGYTDGWNHQRLFFTYSPDGLYWGNLREFMHRRDSQTAWDNKSLYRPSFCYDNRGNCHLFYGASTLGYSGTTEKDAAWGIGHAVGANPTAVVGLRTNGEKINAITLSGGSMILDRILNKPLWRNAGNLMWIDYNGREIDNYWTDYNYIGMTWEQGGINTTDGTDVNDTSFTKQIRTRLFNSLYPLLRISIASGYRAMLFKYVNGVYQSRTSWMTENTTVTNEFVSYRLMITPTDNSTLSAANGNTVCKVYEQ